MSADYEEYEAGSAGTCEQRVYRDGHYEACDKPATVVIDPFIREIYGENAYRMLCDTCYYNRKEDT